jgi:hypothetical protein
MPTTRRIKRRKATRGGSRSLEKQRIENARRAAAGRNFRNWAQAATAATTGERHRRRLAERLRLWGNNRNPKLHPLTNSQMQKRINYWTEESRLPPNASMRIKMGVSRYKKNRKIE